MEIQQKHIPQLRFPEFLNDGEWEVKRLGEIAESFTGLTYSPEQVVENGGTLVLRSSNIKNGVLSFEDNVYVQMDIPERAITHIGDLLICVRNGSKNLIGKSAVITKEAENTAFGAFMTVLRAKEGTDQEFLNFLWQSDMIQNQILRNLGSTINQITSKDLNGYKVIVPPLSEQRRIAACLSALDEMLSATNGKLEQLKAYKKGLMQKLFPAKGKKLPELRFKEFEKDGEWEEKMLGEIGETYTGLSGKDKNDFGHGDAEYITYMNVFSNPIAKKEMNQPIEIDGKQHSVGYGDVFFTTSSETPEEVGMSSIWLEDKENVYLNSFCFGYRLKEKFDHIYMSYYFRSDYFRKKMIVLAQGISRYNISKNKAMQLPFQYPTILEQRKIADSLTSIDEMINQYTNKVTLLELYKKGLMQQMFPTNNN